MAVPPPPPPPQSTDPSRTRVPRARWERLFVARTNEAIKQAKAAVRRGSPLTLGPAPGYKRLTVEEIKAITVAEFQIQLNVILESFRTDMTQEGNSQLAFFLETGERFANQQILRVLGELGADPNVAVIFDLPTPPEVRKALRDNLGELIKGISSDLARTIITQVRQGVLNGDSFSTITKAIDDTTKFGPVRSRMIARTESLRAFNRAAEERYKSNGIKKQMWVAAFDERTDPDCEALHGEVFPVGESHPPMPLHPNCRCTWVPVIDSNTPFGQLFQTGAAPEGRFPDWYPVPAEA